MGRGGLSSVVKNIPGYCWHRLHFSEADRRRRKPPLGPVVKNIPGDCWYFLRFYQIPQKTFFLDPSTLRGGPSAVVKNIPGYCWLCSHSREADRRRREPPSGPVVKNISEACWYFLHFYQICRETFFPTLYSVTNYHESSSVINHDCDDH